GLERLRLHDLRRTAATPAVAAGTRVLLVQQWLACARRSGTRNPDHTAHGAAAERVAKL
ncbi:MAG: hypothetical protein QOK36_3766, partial [Gaiellales bacterium]|nr:hypothetical protein [Gaiellales bacterium]